MQYLDDYVLWPYDSYLSCWYWMMLIGGLGCLDMVWFSWVYWRWFVANRWCWRSLWELRMIPAKHWVPGNPQKSLKRCTCHSNSPVQLVYLWHPNISTIEGFHHSDTSNHRLDYIWSQATHRERSNCTFPLTTTATGWRDVRFNGWICHQILHRFCQI